MNREKSNALAAAKACYEVFERKNEVIWVITSQQSPHGIEFILNSGERINSKGSISDNCAENYFFSRKELLAD